MADKKFEILDSTIAQDQQAVAIQWANTFLHNPADDIAINMAQLLLACVAAGDFKTHSYLSKSTELKAPPDQLTISDYLSHASRIIVDYQQLDESNQQEFLSYFPAPAITNKVIARSATHDVHRGEDNKAIEGKGFMLGLAGQLPTMLKTPRDFGVNIAMGGTGQENFFGKKISPNGYSGHFYFHHNDNDKLLLLGLEQTAPAASAFELLYAPHYPEDEQQGCDQFEQGHSLKGASDRFTAAGSLYFSDPIYQAKLLVEKGCFPPHKYGGMQATLTNENWPNIIKFLEHIKELSARNEKENLIKKLQEKPCTATSDKDKYLSFISLDFESYLKEIYRIFKPDDDLKEKPIAALQSELLGLIKKLQEGKSENYQAFNKKIQEINLVLVQNIPAYQKAIDRIQNLFMCQLEIDPELEQTHHELLLRKQYDDLQEEAKALLEELSNNKCYFQAASITVDDNIGQYIERLDTQINFLKKALEPDASEEGDMSSSWLLIDSPPDITVETINLVKKAVEQAHDCLKKAPRLCSETTLNKLKETEKNSLALAHQALAEAETNIAVVMQQKKALEAELAQMIAEKNNLQEKLQEVEQVIPRLQQKNKIALARQKKIAAVQVNIDKMKAMALDLGTRGFEPAQEQADNLILGLEGAMKTYLNSDQEEEKALESFKSACKEHLEAPRKKLFKHRGFKQIIGNTLLAVALLGVGYLGAILINKRVRGHYAFFPETKNSKQVAAIKGSVNELSSALGG